MSSHAWALSRLSLIVQCLCLTPFAFYTPKYAGTDGELLWEKRYNGPANRHDYASSLALGPNGIVAITGGSASEFGPGAAFDNVTVVYRETLPLISVALVPAVVRLRFTGVPGRSYIFERSLAVTGPWSVLATPTAPVGSLIEFVDTNRPATSAFYRTSTP